MKGWNSKTLLTCFTDFRRLGAQWIHHFSRRKTISPSCALFVPRVAHEILTGKKWKIQHITGTYTLYIPFKFFWASWAWNHISMTSLWTHTVAHSTRPSFRPKTNNQPIKKFLSLVVSWVKVIKNLTSF